MLKRFITKNYKRACDIQDSFDHDRRMIRMLRPKGSFDRDDVYQWLKDYALLQGIDTDSRWAIVDVVRDVRSDLKPLRKRQRDEILIMNLELLLKRFYFAKERTWLSAASKILWCRFPNEVVIYDSFVERTITVLQWLDSSLLDLPRIGSRPSMKAVGDLDDVIDFYERYEAQVRSLFAKYTQQLGVLRQKNSVKYPYDIRIFDKILWMLGRTVER